MAGLTPMDDALAELVEARAHAVIALDIIEKRRDLPGDAEDLRAVVGTLARIVRRFEVERGRWR